MKKIALLFVLFAVLSVSAQEFTVYKFAVSPLKNNINTKADEYAPSLSWDGLNFLYTSTVSKPSAEPDLFSIPTSAIQNGNSVKLDLNTAKNDGSIAFFPDGKTAVVASDGLPGCIGDVDLFICDYTNGKLSNPRNLGANVNSKKWESQPAISPNGNTIYFVSNRKGGFGGCDIWKTTRNANGTWSDPVNMGKDINTKKDEKSPYITGDGNNMIFASKGHQGFGGFDLFIVPISYKGGEVRNLGDQINTAADELFMFANGKGGYFYFASNRSGGAGGYDIYSGTPNVFTGFFTLEVSSVDSLTGKTLPSQIRIIDKDLNTIISVTEIDNEIGSAKIELPAGREYRVECSVRDMDMKTKTLSGIVPGAETQARFEFGPFVIGQFDLGKYQVPFFVRGYYRVNNTKNLEDIFGLVEGKLAAAEYIERFPRNSETHKKYQEYSKKVEQIFGEVVSKMVDDILPKFERYSLPDEIIEIEVDGYADPTRVRENAKYIEEVSATFEDPNGKRTIANYGIDMNNDVLSGLRAFHSAQYLDEYLEKYSKEKGLGQYEKLKKQGRIRFKCVGMGVSRDSKDFDAQRRIGITLLRRAR